MIKKEKNVFELVIQVLKNNQIPFSDSLFSEIYERFHTYSSRSSPKIINYSQLCQLREKDVNNWITIIQRDKIITHHDSIDACWHMNPFEDAIVVVKKTYVVGFLYEKINVFIYKQSAFSDVIFLPNIEALKPNFTLFNVYAKSGTLITTPEVLSRYNEIVCISKQELRPAKTSKRLPTLIVMRYAPFYE